MQAVYLMTSSKKGSSAHQLHRILEITYKSTWFLAYRIREAMTDGDLNPFGGNDGVVEVDETFIGHPKGAGEEVRLPPQDEGPRAGGSRDRQSTPAKPA